MQVELRQYEEKVNHGSWWKPEWMVEYRVAWKITLTEVEKLALEKYPPSTVMYKIHRDGAQGEASQELRYFLKPGPWHMEGDHPARFPDMPEERFRNPMNRELFVLRLKDRILPALKQMLETGSAPPPGSETLEF